MPPNKLLASMRLQTITATLALLLGLSNLQVQGSDGEVFRYHKDKC